MPLVKGDPNINRRGRPKGSTAKRNKLEAAIDRAITSQRLDKVLNMMYHIATGNSAELDGVRPTLPEMMKAGVNYIEYAAKYFKGDLATPEDEKEKVEEKPETAPVFSIAGVNTK